jgi:hypothetical protein
MTHAVIFHRMTYSGFLSSTYAVGFIVIPTGADHRNAMTGAVEGPALPSILFAPLVILRQRRI